MKFAENMNVITNDGEQAGQIDRVVLDPHTQEVTHIILREGVVFHKNVVVPVNMIRQHDDDTLALTIGEDDLETLPEYEREHYVQLEPTTAPRGPALSGNLPALYRWYVPAGVGVPPGDAPFAKEVVAKQNEPSLPEGSIPVETGAAVVTSDGATAGSVKRVYTHPESGKATHFVVEQGLVVKDDKLIPIEWVESISEDQIRLVISEYSLNNLPEFDVEDETVTRRQEKPE